MAGKFWSEKETERLEAMVEEGKNDEEIGKLLFRPKGSITSKKKELQKKHDL